MLAASEQRTRPYERLRYDTRRLMSSLDESEKRLLANTTTQPIWHLSLSQIASNTADAVHGLFTDLSRKPYKTDLRAAFTRDDRLLYIGILFTLIGLTGWLLSHNDTYSSSTRP
jgi:hypothetical protein